MLNVKVILARCLSRNFALITWIIFSAVFIILIDQHRTVSFNYWAAANRWFAAAPLYNNNGRGFIYLPQSAIIYSIFTIFSFPLSEKVWRIISVTVFLGGFFRYLNLCIELFKAEKYYQPIFLCLGLLAIPLCFESIRNGQMHLMTTGLMMLATLEIHRKKWIMAGFLISLCFFLKPTAVVFLLLVLSIYFKETWKYFLMWITLFMLAPFATQSTHYVLSQYATCFSMMKIASNSGSPQDWSQIFNLLYQIGWKTPPLWQNAIRILAALVFLQMSFLIKKRGSLSETIIGLLMISMVYTILFNPRTENNDYMILIPVLSYFFISHLNHRRFYHLSFIVFIIAGISGQYYISSLLPGHRNWAAPLLGLLLMVYGLFTALILFLRKSSWQNRSLLGLWDRYKFLRKIH